MGPGDAIRTGRRVAEDLRVALARAGGGDTGGSDAIVVATRVESAYPTAAGSYFSVERVTVGGVEEEGATVGLTTVAGPFVAANVGTTVPPAGTHVMAVLVDGRWAFQYDGGT